MKPTRRSRAVYMVAAVACLGAVAYLMLVSFRANVVYYRTPTEAVKERAGGSGNRFRLAGQVVPGSIERGDHVVKFDVTDGDTTVHVAHDGEPPQMFADEVPVVAEGKWDGEVFASDRIMIRHGNDYEPPEVTTTSGSG